MPRWYRLRTGSLDWLHGPPQRRRHHRLAGRRDPGDPAVPRAVPRVEGPDPARERSRWRPALDRPLPAAGIGRDATLAELADLVVANGLRVGHPGFSGWVTTGPTDVAAAADLAQAV